MIVTDRPFERVDLLSTSTGATALADTSFAERPLLDAFERLMAATGGDPERFAVFNGVPHPIDGGAEGDWEPVFRFVVEPLGGTLELRLSRALFERLFDRLYGGDGQPGPSLTEASAAQTRFARRLAMQLADVLAAGWPATTARLRCGAIALGRSAAVDPIRSPSRAAFYIGRVENSADAPALLACSLCDAAIAALAGKAPGAAPPPPGEWRQRLAGRMGDVRLPVRAVLARPEIPVARLLALRVGEVLPIAMPSQIPLSVANLPIARGCLGERDGRAAIRIDSFAKEPMR